MHKFIQITIEDRIRFINVDCIEKIDFFEDKNKLVIFCTEAKSGTVSLQPVKYTVSGEEAKNIYESLKRNLLS